VRFTLKEMARFFDSPLRIIIPLLLRPYSSSPHPLRGVAVTLGYIIRSTVSASDLYVTCLRSKNSTSGVIESYATHRK
jgi:hypothetical protein